MFGRQALKTGGILIALFLIGAHASGWGTLLDKGTTGGAKLVKTFQGRG